MQPTRRARLQSVVLQELATVVPREVKDPRVPPITFTRCEVTEDGSQATVWVTLLGGLAWNPEGRELTEKETQDRQNLMRGCLEGLASASGYLRRHLASILDVRHIPTLIFKEDRGLENTIRVHELLKEIGKGSPSGSSSGTPKE